MRRIDPCMIANVCLQSLSRARRLLGKGHVIYMYVIVMSSGMTITLTIFNQTLIIDWIYHKTMIILLIEKGYYVIEIILKRNIIVANI